MRIIEVITIIVTSSRTRRSPARHQRVASRVPALYRHAVTSDIITLQPARAGDMHAASSPVHVRPRPGTETAVPCVRLRAFALLVFRCSMRPGFLPPYGTWCRCLGVCVTRMRRGRPGGNRRRVFKRSRTALRARWRRSWVRLTHLTAHAFSITVHALSGDSTYVFNFGSA